jgi:hypothetical protein
VFVAILHVRQPLDFEQQAHAVAQADAEIWIVAMLVAEEVVRYRQLQFSRRASKR